MEQNRKSGQSSVPPPEQGSPQVAEEKTEHGRAEKRLEKGEDTDPNPLAPPVNTQAGS